MDAINNEQHVHAKSEPMARLFGSVYCQQKKLAGIDFFLLFQHVL